MDKTREKIIEENEELKAEQSKRNQFGNTPLVSIIGELRLNLYDYNKSTNKEAQRMFELTESIEKLTKGMYFLAFVSAGISLAVFVIIHFQFNK